MRVNPATQTGTAAQQVNLGPPPDLAPRVAQIIRPGVKEFRAAGAHLKFAEEKCADDEASLEELLEQCRCAGNMLELR